MSRSGNPRPPAEIAADLGKVITFFEELGLSLMRGRIRAYADVLDAAGRAHVAAALLEDLADFAVGAVAVVGEDIDQDGDAAGSETFVREFVEADAIEFAGAFLDGAFDIRVWHRHAACVLNGDAQADVHAGIAAAVLGRDHDRSAQLAPQHAAFGVHGALFVLDIRPMGMA